MSVPLDLGDLTGLTGLSQMTDVTDGEVDGWENYGQDGIGNNKDGEGNDPLWKDLDNEVPVPSPDQSALHEAKEKKARVPGYAHSIMLKQSEDEKSLGIVHVEHRGKSDGTRIQFPLFKKGWFRIPTLTKVG